MRPVREGDLLTIHGMSTHEGHQYALIVDSTAAADKAQWRHVPAEVIAPLSIASAGASQPSVPNE
jgi:hypothetical protein